MDDQAGAVLLIAVVAVLLLGMSLFAGLRYLGPRTDLAHQKTVNSQMTDVVRKSLWTFAARSYRLPCPADGTLSETDPNYGIEQPSGSGTCKITGASAVVPWLTLGLSRSAAQDAWGGLVGYAVTGALTDAGKKPYKLAVPSSDAVMVSVNGGGAKPYAYVLMSFGPDRGGYNLSGKQTQPGNGSNLTATETASEGTNRTAIAGGGLNPTNFTATASSGTAPYTNGAIGAAGAQWLVFESSTQLCADLNGHQRIYCTPAKLNPLPPPSSFGGGGGKPSGGNFPPSMMANTSSSATSNPNGRSSNSSVNSSGATEVLVLGTTSNNPGITSAPVMFNSSQACSWLQFPFLLTTQTLRAYFEFSTGGTTAGDGFTMSFLPGATNLLGAAPCGGTPGGNTNEGSYLGFVQITDGGGAGSSTATAAVSNSGLKPVTGVTVGASGAGYLYIPPVEITGAGTQATALVSSAQINSINVTYPGMGYIAAEGASVVPNAYIAPAGGAGYSWEPFVVIESAAATGCTGNGCSDARAFATVTNGQVTQLTIISPGSGYVRAPAVWIESSADTGCNTGCADAIGASSTIDSANGAVSGLYISQDNCVQTSSCGYAMVNSMQVFNLAIDNPGSGYASSSGGVVSGGSGYIGTPSVLIQGSGPGASGGHGAAATAAVSNGSVTGVTVTSGGQNYGNNGSNVIVTIAGGGIAYGTISKINSGQVTQIDVTDGGANYTPNSFLQIPVPPPLNCSGNCPAATAIATIGPGGTVTAITLTSGGSGYSASTDKGNWVPVTDGSHVVAVVTATVNNGTIMAIGGGAPTPVAVTINPLNETVTPVAATATATVGADGTITGLTLTYYGSGYTHVPSVTIAPPPSGTTATAHVTSMGVQGIVADTTNNRTGYSGSFTAIPSIGIDPPTSACTSFCFAATAGANISINQIQVVSGGSGYQSGSTAVSLPPPTVLPKFGIEFRTYHHPTDPYYSDYGYHDDWGFFGSSAAASYSPVQIKSALTALGAVQSGGAYTTGTGIAMPQAYPGTQSFASNIRHDDNTGCDGPASVTCVPEYLALLIVDSLQHDDTYHYSASGAGNPAGANNAAYTVSSSCDSVAGGNAALHGLHDGGFIAGGGSTGGALASTSAPTAGGCSYDNTVTATNIITDTGPITDTQNNSGLTYHSVRVEIQRYCDPACGSCGNPGTDGDTYMHVAAYLDCDSNALAGQSCTDMTQNLLMAGSRVYSVSLVNAGSGYTRAPAVVINGGGGSGATATATVTNGSVDQVITVTNSGSGFYSAPTVSIETAASTGCVSGCNDATATASLSGLPLAQTYSGTYIYAVNYCTPDPGAVNWTSSASGLKSFDSIIAGFTAGAGAATRGVLIRNLQIGSFN